MRGLGTDIEVRLTTNKPSKAETYFNTIWGDVVDFETRFSRFRAESELSQFNMQAGKKMKISEPFKDILETAKRFGQVTDGMFNPFVLPCLQRGGYMYSMNGGDVESTPDFSKRKMTKLEALEIGEDWAQIPEDTAIDLGGIGKGYLADQLAGSLGDVFDGFCISLGGDIIAKGVDGKGEYWNIDVQSAKDRAENSARFESTHSVFGLATSGHVRDREGRLQEHQINPTSHIQTDTTYDMCSVAAADATTADVLASSMLLGGPEYARPYLENETVYAVLFQGKGFTPPLLLGKGFILKS